MIRVNLLQPEKREVQDAPVAGSLEVKAKEKKKPQHVTGMIFLLLILVMGALFISQKKALPRESQLLEEAQAEKNKLKDVLTKLKTLENQKGLFGKKISLIEELKSIQDTALAIMTELNKNMPEWIWLNETSYSNKTIKMKGAALSNNLIADYIFNLEKSPYLSDVNLISSTQKREKNNQYVEFSLTAKYVLPSAPNDSSKESEEKEKK